MWEHHIPQNQENQVQTKFKKHITGDTVGLLFGDESEFTSTSNQSVRLILG